MKEEQSSINNLDRLVFQLAVQTRELSQKKNELKQQIKVCRDDIAEKKSYIGTTQENVKKLEERVSVLQSAVMKNKENAKTMKVTNERLLQYKQALKTELESRKASYNNDLEVFEERISSYRKTLQSFKECYHQSPLAQKLLALQAENEKIESRIKAWDDQIMTKQKELDHLTDLAANAFSTEEPPDTVFKEQPTIEQEEQSEHQTKEDSDSSIIDISSIHLNQTDKEDETYAKANTEEIHEQHAMQDPPTCFASPEKANKETWPYRQPTQSEEIHSEAQDEETSKEDSEQIGSGVDEVLEDETQRSAPSEEKAPAEEDHQEAMGFPQTSQEVNPQSFSDKTPALSTPTFPFNFSPASSPRPGTFDTKSPAFHFSLNSNISSSSFPGFGFDMGSSQEEESFAFTDSVFNVKKSAEAQPSSCPEFLFNQPEQSEDFQFAFTAKNPPSGSKESGDEFPFSFNF